MDETNLTEYDRWYLVWRDDAGRSLKETAELCGVPYSTVQYRSDVDRWRERARADDKAKRELATDAAFARLAESLPVFVDTVVTAAKVRLTSDRKLPPDAPSSGAVKAALSGLAIFGIAPLRMSTLHLTAGETANRVSPAELDALLAATHDGSDDALGALLALAAGQTVPQGRVSRDFPSTQPGGRVVPGLRSPDKEDSGICPQCGAAVRIEGSGLYCPQCHFSGHIRDAEGSDFYPVVIDSGIIQPPRRSDEVGSAVIDAVFSEPQAAAGRSESE